MGIFKKSSARKQRRSMTDPIRPSAWAYSPSYGSRSYLGETPAEALERMRKAAEASRASGRSSHTTAA
jgi:hypothetical protein